MQENSVVINAMITACQKAGGAIMRDFGELENLQITSKGFNNFVSSADLKAERIIINELQKFRPQYHIFSEESGYIKPLSETQSPADIPVAHYRWVIDPIDGTSNFIHGNPAFAVCIALERVRIKPSNSQIMESIDLEAETIASVIYQPTSREFFYAEKNMGAFHVNSYWNKNKIKVAGRSEVASCLVGTLTNKALQIENENKIFKLLSQNAVKWRISGSAALDMAYLASGKYDIIIFPDKLVRWDIAPGFLLIHEAGGVFFDILDQSKIANTFNVSCGLFATNHLLAAKLTSRT